MAELIKMNGGTKPNFVVEVGCGLGNLLYACNQMGITAKGWDVNPYVIEWAREKYDVDATCELLTADHNLQADLIISICCLEHLTEPVELLRIMMANISAMGQIAVAVPFLHLDRHLSRLRTNELSYQTHYPFQDNDVHVTLFSPQGMIRMGERIGLKVADHFIAKDADGKSETYEIVLFIKP